MDRRSNGGWTLLELMLAMVIGALIITLLYSIYHTTMRTVEGQEERRKGIDKAATVLDQLGTDLARAWLPGEDDDGVFTLEPNPNGAGLTLSFCTLVPSETEKDLRWVDTGFVVYQTRREGLGLALTRSYRPLVGPGRDEDPATNRLADTVNTFEVEVFDGEEWTPNYTSEESQTLPRAARLHLEMEDETGVVNELNTEIFIPTGSIILSAIQRVSAPAPTNTPVP